ncbi:MAG: TrmB family transcriptional regulator [Brevinematia bacterium]
MALSDRPDLIESFEKLGLSPNEAKVYLALLEQHPITGYQLSKTSGILRPVVYEMLNRLVEKGGARIIKSNPDTYIPVEIDEFLKNIESEFNESKKNISKILKESVVVDNTDFFWNIIGRKNILNSIFSMIERAEEEIYVWISEQQLLDEIIDDLERKLKNNVNINIFSYYSLDTKGITLYSYQVEKYFKAEEFLENSLVITIDRKETMIVNFSDERTAKGVYSKNNVIVETARRTVINQIYLYRFWRFFGTDRIKTLITDDDRKLLEKIERHLEGKDK